MPWLNGKLITLLDYHNAVSTSLVINQTSKPQPSFKLSQTKTKTPFELVERQNLNQFKPKSLLHKLIPG